MNVFLKAGAEDKKPSLIEGGLPNWRSSWTSFSKKSFKLVASNEGILEVFIANCIDVQNWQKAANGYAPFKKVFT